MRNDRPKRETMSLEEATISDMWEIAAFVELLERKGLTTKQELHEIVNQLREKKPHSRVPDTAFPDPSQLTDTENQIIDDIHEMLNKYGLNSVESLHLLERLGAIMRWDAKYHAKRFANSLKL
jgi:hypothetical protein